MTKYVSGRKNGKSKCKYHTDRDCYTLRNASVHEATENELEWHELEPCGVCSTDGRSRSEMGSKFTNKRQELIESVKEKYDEKYGEPGESMGYNRV